MHPGNQQPLVEALSTKYPVFPRVTIERWVARESDKYHGAKIDVFVPILVFRAVDASLREFSIRPDTEITLPRTTSATDATRA